MKMSEIKVGIIGYCKSAKIYNLPYLLPVKEFQVYAFLQRKAASTTTRHDTTRMRMSSLQI